jgi:tRNA G18 (ribose-2'-O)-methylase SpoU
MALAATGAGADRALSKTELRIGKPDRAGFFRLPRQPITVVLDGVRQNYNLGAIFRLCDAFLVERLVICGARVELHKRKLVQAARGTQHWVPWQQHERPIDAITEAKAQGAWIVAVEQTTASVPPEQLAPRFPACLVLGSEERGVSSEAVAGADAPMKHFPLLGALLSPWPALSRPTSSRASARRTTWTRKGEVGRSGSGWSVLTRPHALGD